ncbi:MAG: polysaccharide deacetylase family protein, partial [Phycisphaerae bacterium]|nr:polysaccharide deacetylase family protein [Phycisphaerae bacterium]
MLDVLLGLSLPGGGKGCLSTLIFHRVTPTPDPLFPGEVHAAAFDEVCRWLRSSFNVLSLADAVQRLRHGELPARALSITFDDGYADNHDVALPILQRYGLPATCFVATGFLDGGCMWNDRVIEAVRLCRHDTLPGIDDLLPGPPPSLRDHAARRRVIDSLLQALKYLPIDQRLARTDALVAAAGVTLPHDLMMSTPQVAALARAGITIGGHTVNHPILARMGDEAAYREIVTGRKVL